MLSFLRRNRLLVFGGVCLVLAAGLALTTDPARPGVAGLGRFFLEAMAPFQRGTTVIGQVVAHRWRNAVGLLRARDENVALRERVRNLRQEIDRLAEVQLENTRLRRLLAFRRTLDGDVVTARIIGHDARGLSHTLVIDHGERNGVGKGAAVLAPEGVVGWVFLASRHAARVLLITDRNSGVDALVQRSRARGIVQGSVDGRLSLKYVKRTEDVQVGDAVVTSGLDGIFPRGVPIGDVTAVDKSGPGLFQNAEVVPRVRIERLEEVLVRRAPTGRDELPPLPEP